MRLAPTATAVTVLLLILHGPAAALDPATADAAPPSDEVVPGQFVVTDAATADVVDALAATAEGLELHDGAAPSGGSVVVVTGSKTADPATEARRLSDELGAEVLPMVRYRLLADPAAEPAFGDQWALENIGQSGGTAGADIDARTAWRWSLGAGSVVAVVDSGVAAGHHELAGRLWVNAAEIPGNGIDDDDNGHIDDVNGWDFLDGDAGTDDTVGHGTAVAGLIAGGANGMGIAGVAPEATLMAVRACNSAGCPAYAVAAGIVYAADHGADVVNLSLGAQGIDPLVAAAVAHAADRGVIVVAAAGNSGVDVDDGAPWTPVGIDSPALVGVAWSDQDDRLAAQSNFGNVSVDLAAPGSDILAPTPGDYAFHDGSSFAAPHVSGVAALMRSVDPAVRAFEVRQILMDSTDPVPGLAPFTASGGRLDAAQAVFGARFRDIPRTTFAEDVMWAAARGITKGCNPPANDRFCPSEAVSRGEMAAFLVRALSLAPVKAGFDPFEDDDGSIFEEDIERLAAAGITRGCSPTEFCPHDPVTRGQMAAFLVRAFGFGPAPGGYDPFTDDDGSVFEAEIERLAHADVTRGCSATSFCPADPVTRGQMAAFLRRSG